VFNFPIYRFQKNSGEIFNFLLFFILFFVYLAYSFIDISAVGAEYAGNAAVSPSKNFLAKIC